MTIEDVRDTRLDGLCDRAETALDEGDAPEALRLADEALVLSPKDPDALILKAEALLELDDEEEADKALARLRKVHGDDPLALAAAAALEMEFRFEDHEVLERVLESLERAAKLAKKSADAVAASDVARLQGRALSGLDDLSGAADAFERARAFLGEAAEDDLLVDLATAWFEVLRFDEAKQLLEDVLSRDPQHADAIHYLGLVAERAGDEPTAEKLFAKARALDPDAYPTPIHMSEESFADAVEAALDKVPEKVRRYLANVPVMVEPLPSLDDLKGPPALSPLSVGMFRGTALGERSVVDPSSQLPSSISLFQKNLERYASSDDELIEEIETTLLHEVGHFVGWDEDDLYERGLH